MLGKYAAILGLLFAITMTAPAFAASPGDIQGAIDRGKDFLYRTEKSGNWETVQEPNVADQNGWSETNEQYTGLTALATYALLASGESAQDPRLKGPIAFLKRTEAKGTYALSLRCLVWNMLPIDPTVREAMRKDHEALQAAMHTRGEGTGMWGYGLGIPGEDFDHSASQFAILGLWALNQSDVEILSSTWSGAERSWEAQQLADGSWAYFARIVPKDERSAKATLSMTAAGCATLFITQDFTHMAPKCAGDVTNPAIDRGMQWIGSHLNELQKDRRFYTLFGISRVGLASGFKYIGNTDWFNWGSDIIVHEQDPDGHWNGLRENFNFVVDTSFSLLFLSRGRAPVLMNKLEYSVRDAKGKPTPGNWNQRPRDIANLSRMIGKQLESPQNWQIVDLQRGLRDLHDAPILYMSGSGKLNLSKEDQDHLRQFIEEGGLLLGHADCGNEAFAESYVKLGQDMFPDHEFAPLPAEHVIYAGENFPRSNWKTKPELVGLNNGIRELMLLIPTGDPARVWQAQGFGNIKSDISGQLMIDIALYASDQQLQRTKGQTYLVARRDDVKANKTIKVARLKYTGEWNPEPGGWRRLASIMHNDRQTDLDIHDIEPGKGELNHSCQLADICVDGPVKWSDPQLDEVRHYLADGGTILIDCAGGRSTNVAAAKDLIARLVPAAQGKDLDLLDNHSPVFGNDKKTNDISYRRFARSSLGNLHGPQLRGYPQNGRVSLILSTEDLAEGLVGQPIDGVVGYSPESAVQLAEDVLVYAAVH